MADVAWAPRPLPNRRLALGTASAVRCADPSAVLAAAGAPARRWNPDARLRDRPGAAMTALAKISLYGVAGVALLETAVALLAPFRVARTDEWAAAAAEVRGAFRPGDLIVFAPAWVDPIGRSYLGDLMPPEMVGR